MKGAGLCLILIGILMGVEFNFFTNIFGLIDSIPQTVSNTESNLENIKICFIAQIVLMFTAGICLLIDTTNNDSVE